MPDNLAIARKHLRAELQADQKDLDDPGNRARLERFEELLDITERFEKLMGVPHEE